MANKVATGLRHVGNRVGVWRFAKGEVRGLALRDEIRKVYHRDSGLPESFRNAHFMLRTPFLPLARMRAPASVSTGLQVHQLELSSSTRQD